MGMHRFYAGLTALGMTIGTLPALGAAPQLSPPEQAALCLLESALSVAAAVLEQRGCAGPVADFNLQIESTHDGQGALLVDHLRLGAKVSPAADGALCRVTGVGAGDIDLVPVKDYAASYRFQAGGTVLSGDATLEVAGDVLRQQLVENLGMNPRAITDWGPENHILIGRAEEDIIKPTPPQGHWRQEMKYRPEDGSEGRVWMKKVQTVSTRETRCAMEFSASVGNFAHGFRSFGGRLKIMRQQ